MEALSFPLYPGFFPQLVLSVDELVAYRRLGKERVSELVRIVEDADCVYTWTDVHPDGSSSTSTSTRSNHTNKSKSKHNRASATAKCQRASFVDIRADSKAALPCTLLKASIHIVDVDADDILAALAKSRTKDFRKTMAYLHTDRFVDAQTLLTFPTSAASKKPAHSYRAVKWCALRSPVASTTATQPPAAAAAHTRGTNDDVLDFCFLEYAGRKKPRAGSSVLGFIVQESLSATRDVPHLDAFGITRASLTRSGIVVTRTHQSNVLQVTAICQIDGSLEASLQVQMERVLLASVASIGRVKGLLERQRMSRLTYLDAYEMVALADRKACAVCLRGFYFHRKHHCQTCGEVVCSTCAPLRELDEPLFDATQMRVCALCLASAGSNNSGSSSVNSSGRSHAKSSNTRHSSSNDATEVYFRDLQQPPPRPRPRPSTSSRKQRDVVTQQQQQQQQRRSNDSRDSRLCSRRSSDDRASASSSTSSTSATADALQKLAFHVQQIRETLHVAALAEQTHPDANDPLDAIRTSLDLSQTEFHAVLAAIGGSGSRSSKSSGSGGSYRSSHSSYKDHESDRLHASYSYSYSSNDSMEDDGNSVSSFGRLSDALSDDSRLHASAHKDSLVSDRTVTSSGAASKRSVESPRRRHPQHQRLYADEQPHEQRVYAATNRKGGMYRLAHKIEKLQQRLDVDAPLLIGAATGSSIASWSDDVESESEPETLRPLLSSTSSRPTTMRVSHPLPQRPSVSTAASPSEMVEVLRSVMGSRELTQAPPAWRKSFSTAARTSSYDGRLSAASSSSTSSSSARQQQQHAAPSTSLLLDDDDNDDDDASRQMMFVYDNDEAFSISSTSSDEQQRSDHALATRRVRVHMPASPPSLDDESDDNVASLLLFAGGSAKQSQLSPRSLQASIDDDERASIDAIAMRRLVEDVGKLPARMRTSSGQSSGAPSQENHHHDYDF